MSNTFSQDEVSNSATKTQKRSMNVNSAVAMTGDMTRRMFCGGIAGMIAKTATNPLERLKMLSQTGEHGMQKKLTYFNLYSRVIKNEGIIGLWAGNGVNLLRVFPAKSVVFSTNDMYKSMLRKFSGTPSNDLLAPHLGFLAGGLAGMTATTVTYPLDFARGRISGKLAASRSSKEYKGLFRTLSLTIKDEGFLAMYKGVAPTILGAMPYEGIKFGTVALLEKTFPSTDKKDENKNTTSAIRKTLYGGLGGVMAGLLTYPNDTVRRMLQLQGSRGTTTQFNGYFDCAITTYKEYGMARLYRGCLINIIRMAPNAAIQFGSYEILKQSSAEWFA